RGCQLPIPARQRTIVRRIVRHHQPSRPSMRPTRLAPLLGTRRLTAAALAGVMAFPALKLAAQGKPTIDQFLKPGLPLEIISAKKVDPLAWISTERRQRND